jgi:hypothetical protein
MLVDTPGVTLSDVFHDWIGLCKEVLGPSEPRVLRNTFSRIVCSVQWCHQTPSRKI